MNEVVSSVRMNSHCLRIAPNGTIEGMGFTIVRPTKVKWDVKKTVRDNLALMYIGQELVDLVFKGNKRIPNSSIKFDEKGMFHFIVNEVPISESNTLKEICAYLEHIMG